MSSSQNKKQTTECYLWQSTASNEIHPQKKNLQKTTEKVKEVIKYCRRKKKKEKKREITRWANENST